MKIITSIVGQFQNLILLVFLLSSCSATGQYHKAKLEQKTKIQRKVNAQVSDLIEENLQDYVIVKPGQTLRSISIKNHVIYQELIKLNNLKPPYDIKIGQKLKLPKGKIYLVKPGDSLKSIAKKFNLDPDHLIKINGLKPPYYVKNDSWLKISQTEAIKALDKKKASKPIKIDKFYQPVVGKIIRKFGKDELTGIHNDGINIQANLGAKVHSLMAGTVIYTGDEIESLGNLVIVKHEDQLISTYAHLSKINVKKGDKISAGDILGLVGNTGDVSEPQLYFSIRKGEKKLNPKKYFKG